MSDCNEVIPRKVTDTPDDRDAHLRALKSEDASPHARSDAEQSSRLDTLLGEVIATVRGRTRQAGDNEKVLLDEVVGGVRCLCIEHEPGRLDSLSPRQQQIAGMVAAGCTNQAIARSLEISIWTVSTHLRRIFAKLAVSSRSEMVAHLLATPIATMVFAGATVARWDKRSINVPCVSDD